MDAFVLCLTNTVAANFTANVLLAVGARPAMIEEPSEAAELAAAADATLVNVGTVTAAQAEVMRAAIASANAHGRPWTLDPVACHVLSFRRALVGEFLAAKPALVRGNHAEIDFVRATWPDLAASVPMLSTGETDRLWRGDGAEPETISGGVARLQDVTATGCAQGAVCAAFLGRGHSPVEAARAASVLMKRAGERAFAHAAAPGSFQIALVDALWELSHA